MNYFFLTMMMTLYRLWLGDKLENEFLIRLLNYLARKILIFGSPRLRQNLFCILCGNRGMDYLSALSSSVFVGVCVCEVGRGARIR